MMLLKPDARAQGPQDRGGPDRQGAGQKILPPLELHPPASGGGSAKTGRAVTLVSCPGFHLRLRFLVAVLLVSFAALGGRLWQVQIEQGPAYAAQLLSNRPVRVRLPPLRGEIRDRHGILLAGNRSRYDIEFDLPEMVRGYRERSGGSVPVITYTGRVREMAKILREPDIVQIVEEAVVPRLRKLGLPSDYDREDLARHFRVNGQVPFTFLEDADFVTVAKFSEHDLGLPGVRVAMKPVRHYPYGAMAAHILGYVGDPQELASMPDAGDFQFYDPNVEGKADMELALDGELRGVPGVRLLQRNVKGVIDKELGVKPPYQGSTVHLTLDARIQFIAEQALRAVGRAGAVVVDPNNGEILAMVSVPSFDPNTFVPSIPAAQWNKLTKDTTDPLVNRAISAYPPGSTFKLVTALAGLRRGLAKTCFTCSGGVSYGDHYFQCWRSGGHGQLTLSEAIKVSCNAFFYQYGNAAGIESINSVGAMLGLGLPAGTGLTGEQAGILPGPQWLKYHYPQERWSSAYTANVSIGQGYDLVSPLQLVMAYSAVANGGTSYYPRLVGRVADSEAMALASEQRPRTLAAQPYIRANLSRAPIAPADMEMLRAGLWRVVNEDGGTARRARLAGGIVAGKTGTAQASLHGREDTIAWFVCFAPYEKPKYAVCVMVQGGAHGGSVAAPIAAKILEETLAMDRGAYQPLIAALPPARHRDPFRMIEAVNLESASPRLLLAGDDEPAGPSAAGAAQRADRREFTPPSLKKTKPVAVSALPPPDEIRRAEPVPERKSVFQRLFGSRR